jgi:hypothetical protein
MSPSAAASAVPTFIPVSGTLTDAEGAPLKGRHEISIIWFDVGGNELLAEDLIVEGSALNHLAGVGDNTTLAQAAARGAIHEIELVVDGEVMQPRMRIGSVPYALLAGRAASAAVATNSIQLNGKPAADFVTREQHSWATLPDKPNFLATPPLIVGASTHDYFLSLQSCQEGEGLVTLNNGWMCAPVATAASLTRSSSSIEADGDMLEVKQGSISAFHIDAQGLAPSIITGNALVSYATHDQYLLGARFTSNGQVGVGPSLVAGAQLHQSAQLHVEGLAVADSFAYASPKTKRLAITPEMFRMRGNNDQAIEFHQDGSLALSYGANATLAAPIILPDDAIIKAVSCDRLLTAGNLTGSRARIVEISSLGSLTRTVLADSAFDGILPSNQLQGWNTAANIDTARPNAQGTSRFVLELDWRPSAPGPQAKIAGCMIEYTTSSL